MKNIKEIIFMTLLLVILLMTVGYARFETQLNINGTAEIIGEWNVKITNVEVIEISEGCDSGSPQFTDTTVTFDAKLVKPGDSITYLVTIKNLGTIDAVLSNILYKELDGGSSAILYETTEIKPTLDAGETTTFNIKIEYDKNVTENPEVTTKSITGTIEYSQK